MTRTLLCLSVMACGSHTPGFELPTPQSPQPQSAVAGLHAGFGRADITPAPGFPLAGNSLEGGQATGYRHRLYARALVLEDADGERLAIVTADVGHFSSNLHRLTADRIVDRTGIGADRLTISATHTHSGPGSFYAVRSYNDEAAAYAGYDPAMVEFVVNGFATAIEAAFDDLRPAKAAWDTVVVSAEEGLTRNRSLDAFLLNQNPITVTQPKQAQESDAQTFDRQRREAVDRVWRLLRVDQCDPGWTDCQPRGAFSIYAVHGTGNPPVNTLIDGDIHAIVERELEQHIETLNPALPSSDPSRCETGECVFRSRAFHLFANGTEGDVSPNHDVGTRCSVEEVDKKIAAGDGQLMFRAGRRAAGPRTPTPPEAWRRIGQRTVSDCLERARKSIDRLGTALSAHAIRAFDKAGGNLDQNINIRRAFRSYSFERDSTALPVCRGPRSGTSNLAGAEDGRTRMFNWKFLFFIPSGIEEGNSARDPNSDECSGAKRILLGPLQGLVVAKGGLPEYLQLGVFRVGNGAFGTVPAEVTTEVGMHMKERIRNGLGNEVEFVGIVGLANGYMQYVTTEAEYDLQAYEGGSNLYGPKTAEVFANQLESLAQSMSNGLPIAQVGPIEATPGKVRPVLFSRSNGPRVEEINRAVTQLSCADNVLTASWIDAYPGLFVPADGQTIEFQKQATSGNWIPITWDDDRYVEIHAGGPNETGYEWIARWTPPAIPAGSYRLVLVERELGGEGSFGRVPAGDQEVPTVSCQ